MLQVNSKLGFSEYNIFMFNEFYTLYLYSRRQPMKGNSNTRRTNLIAL